MIYRTLIIGFGALLASLAVADSKPTLIAHPQLTIETTEGSFRLELHTKRAPHTVAHIVELAEKGHFDGLIFHRIENTGISVIQGGGYDSKFNLKEDDKTIPNESGNGLSNTRGTIAMARTTDPHSAGSQFYINVEDNLSLDPNPDRWGYTVFGEVIEGMDVVDIISTLPTGPGGPFQRSVPNLPVIIKKVTVDER